MKRSFPKFGTQIELVTGKDRGAGQYTENALPINIFLGTTKGALSEVYFIERVWGRPQILPSRLAALLSPHIRN